MQTSNPPPLISIITVCFNAIEGLRRTALSVGRQTAINFEYIVQDGASTDGTPEALDRLALESGFGANISIRTQSILDQGIYDAMNRAVSIAKGEWVLFLNADDLLASGDILSRVAPVLILTEADVVYGDVIYRYPDRDTYIAADKPLSNIAKRMIFCHQSVFVRRTILCNYPFDLNYKICADFDFFRRLYLSDFRFERIPSMAISIYEAVDGISSRRDNLFAKEVYKIRTNGRVNFGFWYLKHVAVKLLQRLAILK